MIEKQMLFRLSFVLFVCVLGTIALSAQVPDAQLFAGNWRFEPKASVSQPAIISARTGEILKITVKEPLFRIVQVSVLTEDGVKIFGTPMTKGSKRSAVIDLYTDKRGETNATHPFKPEYVEASQTYWKDGALFRHWAVKAAAPAAPELKEVLTYKVSKDGKTLSIETVPEAGGTPTKFVYKRCPDDGCQ
jgi:hypothetical protein